MTTELQPTRSIVPIIRYSPLQPIAEILGTGFFVGTPEMLAVVTAKHVFTACSLKDDEKFAIAFLTEKGAAIVALSRVIGSLDFDVAAADVDSQHLPGAFPLPLGVSDPPLNRDVFTYEYSGSVIEKPYPGHTHVSFDPYAHKGNVVRLYTSKFPEAKPTPALLTSFPALQGASGAPLIMEDAKAKCFAVVGMMVANVERHLMPAQVVEVHDGPEFHEKISYFLPLGKALARVALAQALQEMEINVQFVKSAT